MGCHALSICARYDKLTIPVIAQVIDKSGKSKLTLKAVTIKAGDSAARCHDEARVGTSTLHICNR